MPEESNLYYGFTRFALELNEITEDIKDHLPLTDSRFRPDQRHLENGNVENAELEKQRIEEMQRSRRREMESRGEEHKPLWFQINKENIINNHEKEWNFSNQYWLKRENPGFQNIKNLFPVLW
jgi:oxysterol-binding protein-related protein 3/6/7